MTPLLCAQRHRGNLVMGRAMTDIEMENEKTQY
jgi:hypothetical protein